MRNLLKTKSETDYNTASAVQLPRGVGHFTQTDPNGDSVTTNVFVLERRAMDRRDALVVPRRVIDIESTLKTEGSVGHRRADVVQAWPMEEGFFAVASGHRDSVTADLLHPRIDTAGRKYDNHFPPSADIVTAEGYMKQIYDRGRGVVAEQEPRTDISMAAAMFFEKKQGRFTKRDTIVALGNAGASVCTVIRDGEIINRSRNQGLFDPPGWLIHSLGRESTDDWIEAIPVERGDRVVLTSGSMAHEAHELDPYIHEKDPLALAEALMNINHAIFEKAAVVIDF